MLWEILELLGDGPKSKNLKNCDYISLFNLHLKSYRISFSKRFSIKRKIANLPLFTIVVFSTSLMEICANWSLTTSQMDKISLGVSKQVLLWLSSTLTTAQFRWCSKSREWKLSNQLDSFVVSSWISVKAIQTHFSINEDSNVKTTWSKDTSTTNNGKMNNYLQ